ncbi:Glycosyltransferase, catalytic subunit of cellulose synthase and poly-beta-1,6-N-acetylglucosamine synthase [Pedobacter steynii]|uniref:Glycosyltransferase, catalytic subunit of cellulose synthase and poly-beta-1,6-N-acetylglucosamine synthase n=1 Tax=Pedobacter steynii TaxID=430522 RepID=A0A1G9KL39_9SPHI|nr:glycosyltransferase family 2 protein [Pedobacter steynii]NQX38585.1 glycosyltransferase family 2 protein [Pedobacter steynii]SDL50441.1 Glycosyltransferase, catalytic subunit of cellulose synthase and poly-beta-1,6-N-acetylglucosamine synthase [Pedobacter steynii]
MIIIFWISLFLIAYTFVGYGLLLYILVRIKRLFKKPSSFDQNHLLPSVTVLVAAYNEEELIEEKIKNSLELDYPREKLQVILITDGSSDRTVERASKYQDILLLHEDVRAGKMAAIKRAMPLIKTEIIVFTDANTFLNQSALKELVKHYQNEKVGAVAGEKRILVQESADASSAGEGFYWKYESALKKWDYELYSNVGAAGELFSIRTSLYEPVESDTIIDDHMIAMRIAEKGFIIAYEAGAYAMETASANTAEELKRKIRIAAGGIQSIFRLKRAANPFNYPVLTFQYISHRVLRWTITPFLLILVFVLNGWIAFNSPQLIYKLMFIGQLAFYFLSLLGLFFESRHIRIKAFFIPYYFCVMNYAVMAGIIRFSKKNQSAAWEKSKRK